MGQTIIEKIIANHSNKKDIKPNDIVDIEIDVRAARDFGGANVIKNLQDNNLTIDDPAKTFFTFDTNPTGSDQKYAANQQFIRSYARKHGIKVFDINSGIGTHLMIQKGFVYSGKTAITTDSHANILGAVGAFGQGMGDKDIAAAFARGKIWFKVPKTVKLVLSGKRPTGVFAKDIVLNLLHHLGANSMLGYAIEIYGEEVDKLTLDERITIASMATEMAAIIIFFTPTKEILSYSENITGKKIEPVVADKDASYEKVIELDLSTFVPMVSLPGKPHDTVNILEAKKVKIDSAFIGSCTNGRIEDMRMVAKVLKDRKVAPGVVLKIVPATDKVWNQCLDEGLIKIFKQAGALVSNAGCAGCAAGQVGQNGPGEITVSTGNRNFPGKQGKGQVYLASPATVAASAVAGYITTFDDIPEEPVVFEPDPVTETNKLSDDNKQSVPNDKPLIVKGRVWLIEKDNVDTDMIFHNRYLAITDINEMGQYAFDNLEGYEDFAKKVKPGDIIVMGKNFGSGSSRQQAVDCFMALGVSVILAKSFGAIYERNAINAGMPIMVYDDLRNLNLKNGDMISVNLETGEIINLNNNKKVQATPFSDVQIEIYQNGGLF